MSRGWRGCHMSKRELAIETTDGCYIRWLNAASPDGLKTLLKQKRAEKLHVGAFYNIEPPLKKKNMAMVAQEREFVFDIDLNDYTNSGIDADDLEACDAGWPIVAFGTKIVKFVLRKHFGFEHMLVVYSGRRGAHVTVHDARACALEDDARAAIVSFMQPAASKGDGRPNYFNMTSNAFFGELVDSHVMPFWKNFGLLSREWGGMGALETPHDKSHFLELLNDKFISERVPPVTQPAEQFWDGLVAAAKLSKFGTTMRALHETVFSYIWPRLDVAVSKRRDHLNKAVFSFHPKTGRIAVPTGHDALAFLPAHCPTLAGLVEGDRDQLGQMKRAVLQLDSLVRRLQQSDTEAWSKPAIQVLPTPEYSLVGKKQPPEGETEDNQWMYTKRSRICYMLAREFFAVASDTQPNVVGVYFRTVLSGDTVHDSVVRVYGGYSPPFRSKDKRFDAIGFIKAVREASARPNTEVIADRAFVCALLPPCRADVRGEERRLAAMADRFADASVHLGNANAQWGAHGIESFVKQVAKHAWDTKYLYL